jgi:hypothetical protein
MELRPEIEPRLDIAEKLYTEILDQILRYTAFVDNHGDDSFLEYENVLARLSSLTNKDISKYNISEYWEGEGAEVLAFRIGLPDPLTVDNITKGELIEIVRRIEHLEEQPNKEWEELTFKEKFSLYLDDYYHNFLKLNFKAYDYKTIFGQQKGNIWWTDEEKVAILWKDAQLK